jgi:hypothetical protein
MNPSSLAPTASGAAFTVTAGNATTGTFSFSIQGTDGTLKHTQPVSLTVGTDVAWTDTGASSATVEAGQSASYTFSAVPVGAETFSGAVNFACANLPALTNCSFIPAYIPAGAQMTTVMLTIATTGPNQGTEFRRAVSSSQYPVPSKKPASPRTGTIGVEIWLAWLLTIPMAGVIFAGFAQRKPSPKNAIAACALTLAWLALLVACGGLGAGTGGSGVTVAVNPSSATVLVPGGTQPFSATVINGGSQTVTWAVNGGSANGTIDPSTGVYTAPRSMPNPATVTVTATSQADPSASGTATVKLTGPVVTVTVSPATASLFANEAGNTWPVSATQQQFSATVNNGSSQTVTWAVTGGSANGIVDATGLYTAPANVPNPAAVTVTATSAQATSPGTATVTIQTPTAVGTYSNIQVTATAAGGAAHTDVVTLTVD